VTLRNLIPLDYKQKRENDKKQHEEASCRDFLEIYNKQFNKKIKFVSLGNPNKKEPDCICSEGLNIEIVTVYYDEIDAKQSWGIIDVIKKRIDKKEYDKKYRDNNLCMENPDEGLFNFINNEIRKKIQQKSYDYKGKLFLLITSRPSITNKQEMRKYIKVYRNFKNNKFDEIWLIVNYDGEHKIYRLAKFGNNFSPKKNISNKFKRIILEQIETHPFS